MFSHTLTSILPWKVLAVIQESFDDIPNSENIIDLLAELACYYPQHKQSEKDVHDEQYFFDVFDKPDTLTEDVEFIHE